MVGQQGILDIIEKHYSGYWFPAEILVTHVDIGLGSITSNLNKLKRSNCVKQVRSIKGNCRYFWLVVENENNKV